MVAKAKAPEPVPQEVIEQTLFERNVPLDKMFVAHRADQGGYARPLNEKRAAKLAKEFDRKAVGVLLLSMRNDGSYAIIDGHHRRDAAIRNGVEGLDAYVYIDLTIEEEARLYRKFGDYLRQTARDRWFAALAERQPEALAIQRMLSEFGLRIVNDANTQHGVAAVQSIWTVAEKWGPNILRETFHNLSEAYSGNPIGYVGPSIIGMAMFLDRFEGKPKYSRKRLIERLQRAGATKIEQNALHVVALEHCSKATAYGKALLALHDSGIKQEARLGEWVERSIPESTREMLRESIKVAAQASYVKRKAGAIAAGLEVPCSVCHAARGSRCIGIDYVHMNRLRRAAHARRSAKA